MLEKAAEIFDNIKNSSTGIKLGDKFRSFAEKPEGRKTIDILVKSIYVHIAILIIAYMVAITTLHSVIFCINPIYLIIAVIYPFITWIAMTYYDDYNYHNIKKQIIWLCVINATLVLDQLAYTLCWKLAVVYIIKIPVSEAMTISMIMNMARLALILSLALGGTLILINAVPFLKSPEVSSKIIAFKIKKVIDLRENKENKYDQHTVDDLETGKPILFKENDRFTHEFLLGQSGTGKTSSVYTVAIAGDINKKMLNMELRHMEYLKMIKAGEAYISVPLRSNEDFKEKYVVPYPKYKDKFNKIKETYPDCGITVMAPNAALNNDVARLCQARGIKINVLDPTKEKPDYESEVLVGINPFDVPDGLNEKEMEKIIAQKASVFTDVIIAVNDKDGATDPYFKGISEAVTRNIAMICMRAAVINKTQTNIKQVQRCIQKFSLLEPLVKTIEDYYKITVQIDDSIGAKPGKINDAKALMSKKQKDKQKTQSYDDTGENNPYYDALQFVKQELLGPGMEKMYDQARGLRNLMNDLLQNPDLRALFNAEKNIDFDEILADNQITVVNTALELGSKTSTAFGLFFMLNLKNAVNRRPMDLRSPHFFYIDEGPQYMHPSIEDMLALFRQYRCSIAFAAQTLAQMEKSQTAKYIKELIQGSGTIILYGRMSPAEMELFSKMVGMEDYEISQRTTSQTSILSANASMSTSERLTADKRDIMVGSELRIVDFQEVTVIRTDQGNVLPGIKGKTHFLDKKEFEPVKYKKVNWVKYAPKAIEKEELTEETKIKEPIEQIRGAQELESTSQVSMNISDIPKNRAMPKQKEVKPGTKSRQELLDLLDKNMINNLIQSIEDGTDETDHTDTNTNTSSSKPQSHDTLQAKRTGNSTEAKRLSENELSDEEIESLMLNMQQQMAAGKTAIDLSIRTK